MVHKLRKAYEEKSTDFLQDKEFTRMMLLEGCFILYYIGFILAGDAEDCWPLRSRQIEFVHHDLFLLENQIPLEVLGAIMNLIKFDRIRNIERVLDDNILTRRKRFRSGSTLNDENCGRRRESQESLKFVADHLLHRLHSSLTHHRKHTSEFLMAANTGFKLSNKYTYRSLKQLSNVGIHFKASSVEPLAHVEFVGRWWWFSADVKLPTITVDDSTKTMLLNLIAYEMCVDDADEWVTSYVCLLDSLIDQPEDVAALRKAGVLDISYGTDKEVVMLFKEISANLVPNEFAYSDVKAYIGSHFESWKNTRLTQLMHEYVNWSLLATFGAVMALFLSAVQTAFAVWSPKGECDDLCMFLKKNRHL